METVKTSNKRSVKKWLGSVFWIRFSKNVYKLIKNNSFSTIKYVTGNIDFTGLVHEHQFKKKYPLQPGEIGLVCCWGIGDTVIVAALAKELLRSGAATGVILLVKPKHQYVAQLFPSVSRIYLLDDTLNYLDTSINDLNLSTQHLLAGHYFYAHFRNWEMPEFIGYKNINILDCYKVLFKLAKDALLERPVPVSEDEYAAAKDLFEKHLLIKGKTILLATDANSISGIEEEFWKQLCKALTGIGFTIVLNSESGRHLEGENIIFVDIPLQQIVPLSALAGYVISIRNGLCDLLSLYNINLTVIYPQIQWYSGPLIDGAGISKMWKSENLHEIEIGGFREDGPSLNDYEISIQEIVNTVANKTSKQ